MSPTFVISRGVDCQATWGTLLMVRRGSVWTLLVGLTLGGFGCGRAAAPPPAVPPASTAKGPQAVKSASICDPPSLAKAKLAAVEKPADPAIGLIPNSITLEPGDPGWQLLVRAEGKQAAHRDLTSRATWQLEPEGVVA